LASPRRFRIKNIPVDRIEIPEVRVTSVFDEETYSLFKQSIQEVGALQPILVAHDGETYWLIDGLHRLQEYKLNNRRSIPAAVIEADLTEVMLQNLSLNRLRGRTDPVEMLEVISHLYHKLDLEIEEIARRSGLSRSYVERLIKISHTSPSTISALKEGLIREGHAYQISRIQDFDKQDQILSTIIKYRLTVKATKEFVDKVIEYMNRPPPKEGEESLPEEERIPLITCHFCGEAYPEKYVRGWIICAFCHPIAIKAIRENIEDIRLSAQSLRLQIKKLQEAAHEITSPQTPPTRPPLKHYRPNGQAADNVSRERGGMGG